jgi:flagellar biosynthesis regulator FlbT
MAYDTDKLFEQAKEIVSSNSNIYFVEDLVGYLPCSKPTFYDHFPINSDRFNELRDLIENNKIKKKIIIRDKLGQSEKAAELLALYRLICTPEERQMLNQQYMEHSGSVQHKVIRPTRDGS